MCKNVYVSAIELLQLHDSSKLLLEWWHHADRKTSYDDKLLFHAHHSSQMNHVMFRQT